MTIGANLAPRDSAIAERRDRVGGTARQGLWLADKDLLCRIPRLNQQAMLAESIDAASHEQLMAIGAERAGRYFAIGQLQRRADRLERGQVPKTHVIAAERKQPLAVGADPQAPHLAGMGQWFANRLTR